MKSSSRNWILCFLVLHHPAPSISNSHPKEELKSQKKILLTSSTPSMRHFKPGVVVEALPESIHYNKYIPLLFQLQVPELSVDTLRLNSTFRCTSDTDATLLCPHIDRILAPIADSMNFAQNIPNPKEGWPFFGKFSCERISPHFLHLSAHMDNLHLYSDQLQKRCPLASNSLPILKNMTMDASDHDGPNEDGLERMFLLQMAGYVGFQTTRLLVKHFDRIRWNNAFTLCQSFRLSIALINVFWLKTVLIPIEKMAEDYGFKLSIPIQELLPLYYKLPLTDCIVGTQDKKRTTLMIRVLVPVVKKGTKYTRFSLTKIPYLIREGGQKKICEIQGFDPKDEILLEETVGVPGGYPILTLAPTCAESELCHIPAQPRQVVIDPCVKGLMNSSVDQVREYCSFDCFPMEAGTEGVLLPIIIKVASNEYSITGGSPSNRRIQVYCNGQLNHTLQPSPNRMHMEVVLPCNCEIRYKAEIYSSSRPCDDPFDVVMPFMAFPFPRAHSDQAQDRKNRRSHGVGDITGRKELIHDQVLPGSWIIPFAHPLPITLSQKVEDNGVWQFVMIWILLVLLSLSNGYLVWLMCRNGLIDLGGIKVALIRWGWLPTSLPPKTMLREEEEDVEEYWSRTINEHHANHSNGRRQLNIEEPHIIGDVQEDWPQHLNRL